jgi:hypothetical protein|nr:MAG TPA: hypothetical protein [Caudoviricetes sp.]
MYLINAIGIRFDLSYEKVDDKTTNVRLSIKAFNNSISNKDLDEELYNNIKDFSFDDNVSSHISLLSTSMKGLYDSCIKGLKGFSGLEKSEASKVFFFREINRLTSAFFVNDILSLTDKGALSAITLFTTGNRGCSVYGTLPVSIKVYASDNSINTGITCIHPDINGLVLVDYSHSKKLTKHKKDMTAYTAKYPEAFIKSISAVSRSVLTMLNTVDLPVNLVLKQASDLRRHICSNIDETYEQCKV